MTIDADQDLVFQILTTVLNDVRKRASRDRGELAALPEVQRVLQDRLRRHAEVEMAVLSAIAIVQPEAATRLAAEPVERVWPEFNNRLSQFFYPRVSWPSEEPAPSLPVRGPA